MLQTFNIIKYIILTMQMMIDHIDINKAKEREKEKYIYMKK